jgi:thioredoxin-related protein
MKKLLFGVAILPLLSIAQENTLVSNAQGKGIAFVHGMTWDQVLLRAKQENKYIFIDFYATWCGPCKWMDRQVYTNDTIGNLVNERFISVKLQMDSTASDDASVKELHKVSHDLGLQYRIKAYPSFLFLAPDGEPVHKAAGAADVNGFMKIIEAATDPDRQFYKRLWSYQHGNMTIEMIRSLAYEAAALKEDSLASSIARDYMRNYLLKSANASSLWTKENIEFVNKYKNTLNGRDRLFRLYFDNRNLIDSVTGSKNYSGQLINFIVYRDEVDPSIKRGMRDKKEPNWAKIEKSIKRNYDKSFVEKNVVDGKANFFKASENWTKYVTSFIRQMELAGIDHWSNEGVGAIILNNDAFEVFKYSNDKKELEEALSWVDKALSVESNMTPLEMDTKANLLYKLGRTKEGMALEERSHILAPGDKEIEDAYEKMKAGEPTWPTN